MGKSKSVVADIQELIKELILQESSFTVDDTAQKRIYFEYSVEYNALRILMLLKYGADGRFTSKNKFAFFDFLLRYPVCLKYITHKMHLKEEFSQSELNTIDSKMEKHITSAWDPDYYNYLSFLAARDLIRMNCSDRFEMELTELGEKTVLEFDGPEVEKIIHRSKLLNRLYGQKDDLAVKEIINKNFAFVKIC